MKTIRLSLAVLVALMVVPATATAAATLTGIAQLPDKPNRIALGPDGNMWVVLDGSGAGNELARVSQAGTVTPINDPDLAGGVGITAGQGNIMWVTRNGGATSFDVGDPPGTSTQVAIAALNQPQDIVKGPDGNLWTASGTSLLRLNGTTGALLDNYPVLAGGRGIASGNDGRLWVADFGANAIRAVTQAGVASNYPVGGAPQDIAMGADSILGFTIPNTTVGRISLGGPTSTTNTGGGDPTGIAFGPEGAWWTANFFPEAVGRLSASDGSYTKPVVLPAGSGPRRIAAGPSNTNLWVTGEQSNRLFRISNFEPPGAGGAGGGGSGTSGGGGGTGGGGTGGGGASSTSVFPPPPIRGPGLVFRLDRSNLSLIFEATEPLSLTIEIRRKPLDFKRKDKKGRKLPTPRFTVLRRVDLQVPAGPSTSNIAEGLPRGRYQVRITGTDADGNRIQATGTAAFNVLGTSKRTKSKAKKSKPKRTKRKRR